MLKTIIKRRKAPTLGEEEASYKHADIPDGRENSEGEPHRFHNPADVHDLLQ